MTRHRFINDGRSPIPMGSAAEYACVCGKRGTRDAIERHLAEIDGVIAEVLAVDGGDTQVNYMPIEPKRPAPTGESAPLRRPERHVTPAPLPPPPSTPLPTSTPKADACSYCGAGIPLCDLPEIAAWSCGHWIRKRPRSIAESFQDMLRIAYQAGATSAATDESFEAWYQREVLQ